MTKNLNQTIPPKDGFDNDSKNIETPRLVNPLETRVPPSPSVHSMRNEKGENQGSIT